MADFIEEIALKVLEDLTEKEKNDLKILSQNDLISLHFTFGMYIRNKYLHPIKCINADNASEEIIEFMWATLNNVEYKPLSYSYGKRTLSWDNF